MPLLPQVENFLKRVADLQKSGIPTIENLNAGQIRQLFNRFHEGTSGQEEQVADKKFDHPRRSIGNNGPSVYSFRKRTFSRPRLFPWRGVGGGKFGNGRFSGAEACQ